MTTLVSNCSIKTKPKQSGQITIFFATSLVILITILAFVVNIGLFVKAKINLQNATDASAYAGAAVQSQQLTRIAYLNWEMRNVFKEWMFKYYVLGNLNVGLWRGTSNSNPPLGTFADGMDFRMETATDVDDTTSIGKDEYNFPSVCIHFAGVASNVCKQYAVPGIPRFDADSMLGIDETTTALIDSIVKTKASDCSNRSKLNFFVANLWTYNILVAPDDPLGSSLADDAPTIAADRAGAWPKAVELALRIRNLENGVNRPPIENGICGDSNFAPGGCGKDIESLDINSFGNERPAKAFWSGYRNLGNDEFGIISDSEMKNSFKLTELAPKLVTDLGGLSTLFMPKDFIPQKYYLDLKVMPINYSIFFTSLVSRKSAIAIASSNVSADSGCVVSKIGIPVPGYPLGFYKNPQVLTYYAVKGEANYGGLFNPFQNSLIKLTAYAAAKPMGGRIGPMLFVENGDSLRPRSDTITTNRRSLPYIMGMDTINTPKQNDDGTPNGQLVPGEYSAGVPIPINGENEADRFWITKVDDPVGGKPSADSQITYGIPNLIYNLGGQTSFDTSAFALGNQAQDGMFVIKTSAADTEITLGLYHRKQYENFVAGFNPNSADPENVRNAIEKARAPTDFEAGNYLIPTPEIEMKAGNFDSFGFILGEPTQVQVGAENYQRYVTSIYAPLYKDGTTREEGGVLFQDPVQVTDTIRDYIIALAPSIQKFRDSMKQVAEKISTAGGTNQIADEALYTGAAQIVYDSNNGAALTDTPYSCKSITGYFLAFFINGLGGLPSLSPQDLQGCPFSLFESIRKYYSNGGSAMDNLFNAEYYNMVYSRIDQKPEIGSLLTAYMPGVLQGADVNGIFVLPSPLAGVTNSLQNMRRNSYSTKLVPLKSLLSVGTETYKEAVLSVFGENCMASCTDVADIPPKNELEQTAFEIDL
jgi:hypothetical protein